MAEEGQDAAIVTFNIKSSSDQKHVVSVPESISVLELKQKLATPDYADIPADRQRLIYSGRVMKDADPLSTYKIKDGNTVHMVKGAASNQQRNPESSSSSVPPNAGVPQNMNAGTGNDPLAGLTGARYAGFAQMPGQDMFGPDGGMGPPQGPEEMMRMLENPMFQSQMNEAMNNPQVIQMLQNNPMLRDQPMLREMLNNPEMRRMMMDPAVLRQSMAMQRMMGGGQEGGGGGMPAPGVTDTTPGAQRQDQGQGQGQGQGAGAQNQGNPFAAMGGMGGMGGAGGQQNPFGMFGQPGMGGMRGQAGQQNPFAALFGNGGMGPPTANAQAPNTTDSNTATSPQSQTPQQRSTSTTSQPTNQPNQPGQQPQQPGNPMMDAAQRMMQNPEIMRMAMNMMGGGSMRGGMGGQGQGQGQNQQQPPFGGFNPFGGMGGMGQQQPADTRPPEEMFAEQLRQLNDMGFFDFDHNVRALRMAGGRVEGAVQMLLGDMS